MEPIQPTANHINVHEATNEQLIELAQALRQELRDERDANTDLSRQMEGLRDIVSEKNSEVSTLKNTNASLIKKAAVSEETISTLMKKVEALRVSSSSWKSTSPGPRSEISCAEVSTTTASSSSEATGATPATPISPLLAAKNEEIAKLEAKVRELMEANAFYTALVAQHDSKEKEHRALKEGAGAPPQCDGEAHPTVAAAATAQQQLDMQEKKIEKLQRLIRQMERERSQQDSKNQALREEATRLQLEMVQVEKWQQAAQEKLRLQMASNKLVEDIRASSEALHTPISAQRSKTTSMTPLQRRKLTSVSPAPTESPVLMRSPLLDNPNNSNINSNNNTPFGALTPPSAHTVDFSRLPPVNIRNPGPKERELLRRVQLYEKYVAEQVAFEQDRQRRFDELEHSRAELFANMNEEIKKQKREILLLKKEEETRVQHADDDSAAAATMPPPEDERSIAGTETGASSVDIPLLRLCLEEATARAAVVRQQTEMYINVVHLHERAITHHLLGALACAATKEREARDGEKRCREALSEQKPDVSATEDDTRAEAAAATTGATVTSAFTQTTYTDMVLSFEEKRRDCAQALVDLRGACMKAYNALAHEVTARSVEMTPPPAAMIESELAEVRAHIARLKATSASGRTASPPVPATFEKEKEQIVPTTDETTKIAGVTEPHPSQGQDSPLPEDEAPRDKTPISPVVKEATPVSSSRDPSASSEPLQPPAPQLPMASSPPFESGSEAHVGPLDTMTTVYAVDGAPEENEEESTMQHDSEPNPGVEEQEEAYSDADKMTADIDTLKPEVQETKGEQKGLGELTAEEEALLLQLEETDDVEEKEEQRAQGITAGKEGGKDAAPALVEVHAAPPAGLKRNDKEEAIPPYPLDEIHSSSTSSFASHNAVADAVNDDDDEEYLPAEEITITAFETTPPPPPALPAGQQGAPTTAVPNSNPYAEVGNEMQLNPSGTTPSSSSFSLPSVEVEDRLGNRAVGKGQPQTIPPAPSSTLARVTAPHVAASSSSTTSDSSGEEFQAEFDPFS